MYKLRFYGNNSLYSAFVEEKLKMSNENSQKMLKVWQYNLVFLLQLTLENWES